MHTDESVVVPLGKSTVYTAREALTTGFHQRVGSAPGLSFVAIGVQRANATNWTTFKLQVSYVVVLLCAVCCVLCFHLPHVLFNTTLLAARASVAYSRG